jgi:phosphohistidine phosphatase SixA
MFYWATAMFLTDFPTMRSIRHLTFALASWLALAALPAQAANSDATAAWAALRSGSIVLLRHANAPGVGDPPGFQLDDCSTQRNLDDVGRAQARALGESFRSRGIAVGEVRTSQWCRTRETAQLAFSGRPLDEPLFNSFFAQSEREPAQTAGARQLLLNWKGPGVLVVVTHQVNVTAITGITPASGEGVVLKRTGGKLNVVGRIEP